MKVTEHIVKAEGKTQFSFEILPPLKGESLQSIFNAVEPLMEFKPPFIDVTYHREEYVYREKENGLLQKQIIRKRPGTLGICSAIQNKFQVDAIPHILCGGFTKEETENFLIDLQFLEIDNVMALRGDAMKSETYFIPESEGHHYASELVTQIYELNKGVYLDEALENCVPTDFCIGVSGYPEKHMEAPSLDNDIEFLKMKIENGAEYVVTQMFFDNAKFFQFVDACKAQGITVPIIPGIKPLTTVRQLNTLPHRFHVDMPEALIKEVRDCNCPSRTKEIGIEWSIAQSQELKAAGVPLIHYYSMGKSDNIKQIAKAIF